MKEEMQQKGRDNAADRTLCFPEIQFDEKEGPISFAVFSRFVRPAWLCRHFFGGVAEDMGAFFPPAP